MKLDPCPFCGSEETQNLITLGSMCIGCKDCGATGPRLAIKTDPAGDNIVNNHDRENAWNTRTASAHYVTVSDRFINDLFKGTSFGESINSSATEKRKLIAKTLRNQIDGYWSGHTAYNIVVDGGFLKDGKPDEKKILTALGTAFLETH